MWLIKTENTTEHYFILNYKIHIVISLNVNVRTGHYMYTIMKLNIKQIHNTRSMRWTAIFSKVSFIYKCL